jgi:hypothetical protein
MGIARTGDWTGQGDVPFLHGHVALSEIKKQGIPDALAPARKKS